MSVIAAGIIGGIIGNTAAFWIGRSYGYRLLLRYGAYVHFDERRIKIGDATKGDLGNGNWPGDLGDKQKRYDGLYTGINAPDTPGKQAQPGNQWNVHPLLDGCEGDDSHPEPDPDEVIK